MNIPYLASSNEYPMPTQLPSSFLTALVGLAILTATLSVHANNITTSAGSLTGDNGSQVYVKFDVTWENSWRSSSAPGNWDAAWIFVKYRTADGLWRHASLSNTGHVAPQPTIISTGRVDPSSPYNAFTNPGVGVFLLYDEEFFGAGTITANDVQLVWEYNVDLLGLGSVEEVRVFAIEMVFVPEGTFAAGSGGTELDAFTLTTINTATANTVPAGMGILGGQAGGYPTGQTAPVVTWPNGFGDFYCMKYEVSQQGYVDFLNTLTYSQQAGRTANAPNSAAGTGALSLDNLFRNGIDIQTPGVDGTTPALYACNLNGNTLYGEPTDGKDITCNWLSWGDLTAYLDWSGLRPMTELEFEKACRGSELPVANEYPWGSTGIATDRYQLNNVGAANEGISVNYSTTLGNALYSGTGHLGDEGPLRVGTFAANSATIGRITAGAGYYGAMELGGGVYEATVTIANAGGRAYAGTHGDGELDAAGDPDGPTWPEPSTADGAGYRGGEWRTSEATELQVSNRGVATTSVVWRGYFSGGRGVRSAP